MFPVYGWPLSSRDLAFVKSLFTDLGPVGFEISEHDGQLRIVQSAPNSTIFHRNFYREAHLRLHRKTIASKWQFVVEFEGTYGPSVFVEGHKLNLAGIDPRLRSVDLRKKANPSLRDCAIVDYLRLYQTVGSRQSVGRENVYILEDHGQENRPIMGVLVLASPRYYQPHRDAVLGWPSPSEIRSLSLRKQQIAERIRLKGLNRMMQLAICCALPPYSRLGAASLLAVAPFVGAVRDDFRSRWHHPRYNRDPDLAAVSTTTSMGLTGTPFQALYTPMFFDSAISDVRGEKWNESNTVYARLNKQHPWLPNTPIGARDPIARFDQLLSSDTWNLALGVAGPAIDPKRRQWLLENMSKGLRKRIFAHVIQHLGLTKRIFLGNPMGVFLGAVDKPALEALRVGLPRDARPILSWEKAVARFKDEFDPVESKKLVGIERRRAVHERINRAAQTGLREIRLSSHLQAR
jgi:hypothetical protein